MWFIMMIVTNDKLIINHNILNESEYVNRVYFNRAGHSL